jgi:ParB/RepB/Spo0J family partition protein
MADQIHEVLLSALRVAKTNARKDKAAGEEDASLAGLAQSIKEHGLLNPLTVRALPDGAYEIVAGQRRYLACQELGLATIPVIIREQVSDTSAVALSLIENVQRADMHPLDKAAAYLELKEQYGGDLRRVSMETGVTLTTIQRYLNLLDLPQELKEELGTGGGAAGVGAMAAIARTFSDPSDMVAAYNQIGGFTQHIQGEILKRSQGSIDVLPELVMQASEGAFDLRRCGTGIEDCPHIPDELRVAFRQATRALAAGHADSAKSLKDIAKSHKK